jgi:hypothetical protein
MSLISPPEPPDQVVLDLHKVGRRWGGVDAFTAEAELQRAGIVLVEIPQKPKKGVRLSDLLQFEEHWRQAEIEKKERQAAARARGLKHKAEADRLVVSAMEKEATT